MYNYDWELRLSRCILLVLVLDGVHKESSATIRVDESATAWQHDEFRHGQ